MAFDPKELSKMNEIAVKVKGIQEKMQLELKELSQKEFNSFVAAGQVKLKMTGDFSVKSILISPDYIPTHTTEELSEAICLAFNNCKYDIDKQKQEITNRYTTLSNETMMKAMNKNKEN